MKGDPPDWWLNEGTKPLYRKKTIILHNATQDIDLDRSLGMT